MSTIGGYSIRAAGVPWVRKEDYEAFLSICEDADALPDTWEEFVRRTEKFEQRLRRDKFIVVRANIDPNTFPDWCKANGCRVNSNGRSKFAGWVAGQTHGGKAN